jgi:hypothetical protein
MIWLRFVALIRSQTVEGNQPPGQHHSFLRKTGTTHQVFDCSIIESSITDWFLCDEK